MQNTSRTNNAIERTAYGLFTNATDINLRKEERDVFANAYRERLPGFLRDGGISYLFKDARFDGRKMEDIPNRAQMVAESIPEWFKNRDLDSIITSKSKVLNWTNDELALIDKVIMDGLTAEITNVILKNSNDRKYHEKNGGMEDDLNFISEVRSKANPSKMARANSKFGPLVKRAISNALQNNAKEGGTSAAIKIKSVCGVNDLDFAFWYIMELSANMTP